MCRPYIILLAPLISESGGVESLAEQTPMFRIKNALRYEIDWWSDHTVRAPRCSSQRARYWPWVTSVSCAPHLFDTATCVSGHCSQLSMYLVPVFFL